MGIGDFYQLSPDPRQNKECLNKCSYGGLHVPIVKWSYLDNPQIDIFRVFHKSNSPLITKIFVLPTLSISNYFSLIICCIDKLGGN